MIISDDPFQTKQIKKYGTIGRENGDNENEDCAVLFGCLVKKHLEQQTKTVVVSLVGNLQTCWNMRQSLLALLYTLPFSEPVRDKLISWMMFLI